MGGGGGAADVCLNENKPGPCLQAHRFKGTGNHFNWQRLLILCQADLFKLFWTVSELTDPSVTTTLSQFREWHLWRVVFERMWSPAFTKKEMCVPWTQIVSQDKQPRSGPDRNAFWQSQRAFSFLRPQVPETHEGPCLNARAKGLVDGKLINSVNAHFSLLAFIYCLKEKRSFSPSSYFIHKVI